MPHPSPPGTATCAHSGTPKEVFGAEASRTAWRVSLAALWYANDTAVAGIHPKELATRMAKGLAAEYVRATGCCGGTDGYGSGELGSGAWSGLAGPTCNVSGLKTNWHTEMYMVAPVAVAIHVSLIDAQEPENDVETAEVTMRRAVLAHMRSAMASYEIVDYLNDYYKGSWVTIAALTMDGLMTHPTLKTYNVTEMQSSFPQPPPPEPPTPPTPEEPPVAPSPVPPGAPPSMPYWLDMPFWLTWAIFGGSVFLIVCACCITWRCVHARKQGRHWRQQRFVWAKSDSEKNKPKGVSISGSGRIAIRHLKSALKIKTFQSTKNFDDIVSTAPA